MKKKKIRYTSRYVTAVINLSELKRLRNALDNKIIDAELELNHAKNEMMMKRKI